MALLGTSLRAATATAALVPGVVDSLVRNRGVVIDAIVSLPTDPRGAMPRLLATGVDGLGARLVRAALELADDEVVRADLAGVGASASGAASRIKRVVDPVQRLLVEPIADAIGLADAHLRATAITATLGGMIAARNVMRLEPLASASRDDVVALMAPVIQALLDPTERGVAGR